MKPTRKPSIIMKFAYGCVAIFFPLCFLIVGLEDVQKYAGDNARASRCSTQVTLSYGEFVRRHPHEGWFHITGGVVDLASATATNLSVVGNPETFGATIKVEAPLRSVKNILQNPIYVSVSSENRELCTAWSHLHDVQEGIASDGPQGDGSNAPTAAAEDARTAARISKYALEHPEKVFFARDVEGIIKPGVSTDMRETFYTPRDMAEDYVVLEEGKKGADYKEHSVTRGVVTIILVALFWGWYIRRMILGWRKRFGKQQA